MARSKSFDPAEKLEVAMNVFWLNGYLATSLEDLEQELSLKRFSIYNAFGDKLSLYKASLDLYLERYYYPAINTLSQAKNIDEIKQFFLDRNDFLTKEAKKGCFIFKAMQEVEWSHKDIFELTKKADTDLLNAFKERLDFFILNSKTTKPETNPESLARWLLIIYRGFVASYMNESDEEWVAGFKQELDHFFRLL